MKSEMVNINCEIVRDLIPLCSEGLCSETSEQKVRKHIETCESCRMLFESIPADEKPEAAVPDESRAFRKVRGKMKRSRLKIALLSAMLTAIVIPVGYLTVCQMYRFEGTQSFETIIQNQEVSAIAEDLRNGRMEEYAASVSDNIASSYGISGLPKYVDLQMQDAEKLQIAYDALTAEHEIVSVSVKTEYINGHIMPDATIETNFAYGERKEICNTVLLEFSDGSQEQLLFVKGVDGKYTLCRYYCFDKTQDVKEQFFNTLVYVNRHDILDYHWFERALSNAEGNETAQLNGMTIPIVSSVFAGDMGKTVQDAMISYREKGYRIDDAVVSVPHYDEERKMLYYEVSLIGGDDKGTCVMYTRLYFDENGMCPPESAELYQDGCTDALADALADFFG